MKVKKLIVLCGAQKTGKTETLRKFTQKFKAVLILKKPKTYRGRDYIGIWKIKGKNVAIVFAGDTVKLISSGYKILSKCKTRIDVVICTAHPGICNDAIKVYGKNSAIVVAKTKANNTDNKLCSKEILKLI